MADITWKTVTLPNATVGVPYEAGLAESGALTAITAGSVTSGSLPPGITLAADFIRLQGTPTHAASYSFKVTLTDTAGAVQSPQLTLKVVQAANDLPVDILSQPPAAQIARTWPS
jgi:hypothetical protein